MFLIVQNDPQCPAGSCSELLTLAGQPFATVAAFNDEPFPDTATLTGIIVLGGEMGVHDTASHPYLLRVLSFMERALRSGTPLIGICLGGQLLSHVAGGTVTSRSPHGEQGICQVELNAAGIIDPLFLGVDNPFTTFQLHNDSFTVPPEATLLAGSAACPAQAFRMGNVVYGVQFHPEVDLAIVAQWDGFSTPPTDHLSGFHAAKAAFDAASRRIITNFITLACACTHP